MTAALCEPLAPRRSAQSFSLFGCEFHRATTSDGGDLFLTPFGLPLSEHLQPENWFEPSWFAAKREKLPGTSAIFKTPTKTVQGVRLDLVVRFSRVSQEVPLDEATLCQYPNVEFNSPFEEFGLVTQLHDLRSRTNPRPPFTAKRPLAIYAPAQEFALWQLGRVEEKFAAKAAYHPDGLLHLCRPYLLLYAWVEGLNALQVSSALGLSGSRRESFLKETTLRAVSDLAAHRFRVIDMKPEHVIFPELPSDTALGESRADYFLVDYELLERF